MNWSSTNSNKADTRQRLLAILASQGVLTEALLSTAHDDADVLEIEITEFEGTFEEDLEDEGEDDERDVRGFEKSGQREKKRQSQ